MGDCGRAASGFGGGMQSKFENIVFLFRTTSYSGEIRSSYEGPVEWMTLDEMRAGGMAPNMEEHIRVMLDGNVNEAYGLSGQTLRLL